jgi:transposase InsO family protein
MAPIFPNLARRLVPTGPNQLWVADLTYIAIGRGFAYLAIILDAWSRRVVGYAVGSYVDVRLTVAALRSAIDSALQAYLRRLTGRLLAVGFRNPLRRATTLAPGAIVMHDLWPKVSAVSKVLLRNGSRYGVRASAD